MDLRAVLCYKKQSKGTYAKTLELGTAVLTSQKLSMYFIRNYPWT